MSSRGPLEGGKQFEALLKYLRDNRGFDYTGYKRNTIVRRIGMGDGIIHCDWPPFGAPTSKR